MKTSTKFLIGYWIALLSDLLWPEHVKVPTLAMCMLVCAFGVCVAIEKLGKQLTKEDVVD